MPQTLDFSGSFSL